MSAHALTWLHTCVCISKTQDRLQIAQDAVKTEQRKPNVQSDAPSILFAQAFERRVLEYVQNMRDDLHADAVPAPTGLAGPWLLSQYSSKCVPSGKNQNAIHARCCSSCATYISKKPEPEHSDTSYHALMPADARADGFWGGPMPPELAALGPLACKIIRLAHVSCCILRVKLAPDGYARKIQAKLRIP